LIVSESTRYNLVCTLKDYIKNTDLDLWGYIVELYTFMLNRFISMKNIINTTLN